MAATVEIIQTPRFDGVVADEIVASIQDAISDHGYCSVVLSGGKTPSSVYRMLSIPPRVEDIEWDKVRLYWGDERWVPSEDPQSNFRLVQETLISRLGPNRHPQLFPVDTSAASVAEGAAAYDKAIRAAEGLQADERPTFDLVLLGVGSDGHVASLYAEGSGTKVAAGVGGDAGSICVGITGVEGYDSCVSMTPEVLFGAKRILFIVKGEAKATIVQRLIEGDEEIVKLPAMRYREVADRVTFFFDSAAAQFLDKAAVYNS